jgi:predicted signal transduction protein with EAL and GGDEF domain
VAERDPGASLSEPLALAGHEVIVTPSIGIAVFPRGRGDVGSPAEEAPTWRCISAKRQGRNLYRFYDAASERSRLTSA